MPSRRVARAIIQDPYGRVLLGLRNQGHSIGQYSLLGGKLETGGEDDKDEDSAAAVRREVNEESGLFFVPIYFTNHDDGEWDTDYFYGPVTGTLVVDLSEHSEIDYFDEAQRSKLTIAFGQRAIIAAFMDFTSIDEMRRSE